jgi:hypothetical protein
VLIGVAAEVLRESTPEKKVAPILVDSAFGARRLWRDCDIDKLVLESKSDLAQRGEASPGEADALALTFAQQHIRRQRLLGLGRRLDAMMLLR